MRRQRLMAAQPYFGQFLLHRNVNTTIRVGDTVTINDWRPSTVNVGATEGPRVLTPAKK
jgi:hypothetical protein